MDKFDTLTRGSVRTSMVRSTGCIRFVTPQALDFVETVLPTSSRACNLMLILATIVNKFRSINYVTVLRQWVLSGNYYQPKGSGSYQALGLLCACSHGYGRLYGDRIWMGR